MITDFHNSAHKVVDICLYLPSSFSMYYYKERSNIIAPASRDSSNVNPTRVKATLQNCCCNGRISGNFSYYIYSYCNKLLLQ